MALFRRKSSSALVKVEERALPATTDLEREFRELYETYLPRLLAAARAQHLDENDAFDVVQSTVQEIWQRWKELPIERRSRDYLFKALHNQIALFKRREKRSSKLGTEWLAVREPVDPRAVTDRPLEREEFLRVSDRIVANLPSRCRESFLLVREVELSYADAADIMGITPDAVRRNYLRAVAVLAEALSKAGYDRGAFAARLPAPEQQRLAAAAEVGETAEHEREEQS